MLFKEENRISTSLKHRQTIGLWKSVIGNDWLILWSPSNVVNLDKQCKFLKASSSFYVPNSLESFKLASQMLLGGLNLSSLYWSVMWGSRKIASLDLLTLIVVMTLLVFREKSDSSVWRSPLDFLTKLLKLILHIER